jgi:predicted RNase H-like HicB family nuclease
MNVKFSTVIEKDDFGYYAYCPELKGCQTQGETLDEVYSNIKEAIDLYLETLSSEELNELSSKEILTGYYEAKVG